MSAYSCQRSCDISRTNKIVRSSCLNNSGSFVSSDGFSICSAASNKSIESNSVLSSDYIIPQQQFRGGTSVLDPKSSDFQWVLTNSSSKNFDNKDRCIQEKLGSSLSRNSNRRGMAQQLHINVLEMKVVKLALLAYHKQFQMKAIHFQIDNTTALSYLVKMMEAKRKYLIELAKEIWKYLQHHATTVTVEYLQSSINLEAGWQSRNSKDHPEWKFLPQIFQRIFQNNERAEMFYFFASHLPTQRPRYIAWKPDPSIHMLSTFFNNKQGLKKDSPRQGEKNVNCSSRKTVSGMVPNPSENVNREISSFTSPTTTSIKPPSSDTFINNK